MIVMDTTSSSLNTTTTTTTTSNDINSISERIETIQVSSSDNLETLDYSFTNEFRIPTPNSYRGIFVSCWDQIEPFEVYLSKNQQTLDKQLEKLLQVPETRKEYIGKGDRSFFYFSLFTIADPLDRDPNSSPPEGSIKYSKLQSLPLNVRANSLKKKQKLKGDAIFISSSWDGYERDISIDQYNKLVDNLIPQQKVFDFENNLFSKSDIIGTILYKSNPQFHLNEEDEFIIKKKNPTAIINEYMAVISKDQINIFTTTFGGYSKTFYSTCTINDHTIYSKIFEKKVDSIRSCHFRALRYLETLQSVNLGHSNIDDKEIQDILNETYYTKEIDDQIKLLEGDANYNKNKQAELIKVTTKDIILDVLEKAALELGEDIECEELFGVSIKKDHKVSTSQNGKIEIHYIKEVENGDDSSSGTNSNKPAPGEEIKLEFIYYLQDGKVVDRKEGKFIYGDDERIIDGLHYAISHMKFGEIALALINSEFAYGEMGISAPDQVIVPPNATIGVLVELSHSKRNKPTPVQLVLMPMQQKINAIKKNNELAKESFKEGLYLKAYRYYRVSKGYCSKKYLGKCDSDELFEEFLELAAQTLTNICICYEKMPTNEKVTTQDKLLDRVMKYCHASLDYTETSKAYRLRSKYYKELKQYQQSLNDLVSAKEIDQINQSFNVLSESEYDKQIQALTRLTQRFNQNELKTFKNYFESSNQ